MTDETKKLFGAPLEVCLEKRGSFYRPCICSSDTKIASVCTKENANRIARLPEMYEAMENILFTGYCLDCRIFDKLKRCDFDAGCPKKNKRCPGDKAWKLLGKVRDGK